MTSPSDNPFASPSLVASSTLEQFRVSDKEVAARENLQAVAAGGLSLFFMALWLPILVSALWTAPWFLHLFPALLVGSGLATVFNHRARARRAWQRLPVTLDETGLTAKFSHGNEWVLREIPWHQIRKVNFVRRGIAHVEIGDQQEPLIADWSILGPRRIKRLQIVLQHYSDDMADEEPT